MTSPAALAGWGGRGGGTRRRQRQRHPCIASSTLQRSLLGLPWIRLQISTDVVHQPIIAQFRRIACTHPCARHPPATRPPLPFTAELLEQRANAPHWGSQALGEAVQAARVVLEEQQAAVPGAAALADTLREAQSALSEAAARLSALPDQASGADLAAAQGEVAAQLQRVSAAAQAAAASLALPGPGDAATSLYDLGAAEFGGYSLQSLAALTAGVAALVALSVPRSDGDDGPPGSSSGSGGGGGGSSRAGSGGGGPDMLPSSWDPEVVAAYYERRPVEVARRVAEVASEAAAYGAALLADMAAGGQRVACWQGAHACLLAACVLALCARVLAGIRLESADRASHPHPEPGRPPSHPPPLWQARWMPTRSSGRTRR